MRTIPLLGLPIVVLVLACMGGPSADQPAVEAPEAASQPRSPVAGLLNINDEATLVRYVWASELNFRESRDPTSKKLGMLSINTPVAVIEEGGPMTRVRVGNGKEGWVGSAFLADTPLTVPEVQRRAAEATDPDEKLSWLERSVALQPDDYDLMGVLHAVYEERGMKAEATWLGERMAWPANIKVAPSFDAGTLEVEWTSSGWEHFVPPPDDREWSWEVELTGTQSRARGLTLSDEWWLLPDAGPAVRAMPTRVVSRVLNECGGEFGLVVAFDATLPADRVAIAYAKGAPPPHWLAADAEVPALSRAEAQELLSKKAIELGAPVGVDVGVGVAGTGWLGRAVWSRESEDTGWWDPQTMTLDVRISAAGKVHVESLEESSGMFPSFPVAERDIRGLGRIETVWDDRCSGSIHAKGHFLTQSAFRCCGC